MPHIFKKKTLHNILQMKNIKVHLLVYLPCSKLKNFGVSSIY